MELLRGSGDGAEDTLDGEGDIGTAGMISFES